MGGLVVALAVALAGYVWMRVAQARGAEVDRERERDGFRRMLAQDPQNIGAHEALGDSLRRAGRLHEAREEYVRALAACTSSVTDAPLRYKLRQVDLSLQERLPRGPSPELDFVLCPQCGGTNSPANHACETCNAVMPYRTFREAMRDKAVLHAAIEAAACGFVLSVVLFVFQSMPLDIKGVLFMATIIVVAWRFLQSLGPRRV